MLFSVVACKIPLRPFLSCQSFSINLKKGLLQQAVMFGKKYANFMFRFPLFSIAVIHHVKTDKLSLAQHNFKCSRSGNLMELQANYFLNLIFTSVQYFGKWQEWKDATWITCHITANSFLSKDLFKYSYSKQKKILWKLVTICVLLKPAACIMLNQLFEGKNHLFKGLVFFKFWPYIVSIQVRVMMVHARYTKFSIF